MPTATKTAKKTAVTTRTPKTKSGLPKPQQRILDAMKGGRPMTRATISDKAGVESSSLSAWLGRLDPAKRKVNEKKDDYKSLLTLGFISASKEDVEGRDVVVFKITTRGKKNAE